MGYLLRNTLKSKSVQNSAWSVADRVISLGMKETVAAVSNKKDTPCTHGCEKRQILTVHHKVRLSEVCK